MFGAQEILLDGPLNLNVTICGLHIVHPFYFVDAEIPIIAGYDLLRAAHIVIDNKSAHAWSEHPDVAQCSSVSEKMFSMVQPLSLSNSMIPLVPEAATPGYALPVEEATPAPVLPVDEATPASCVAVTDTTPIPVNEATPASAVVMTEATPASLLSWRDISGIHWDTPTALTDEQSCSFNPFAPTFCAIGNPSPALNPLAPSFDPEQTTDELPAHINLLYENTVAHTRLSAYIDRQFRDVLRRRADTFAKDSTDLGFCSVLHHDVDTGKCTSH